MLDAKIADLALCVVWFVLGIFTGAMILSDIMEWAERALWHWWKGK